MKCLGCISGCEICEVENTDLCITCIWPLLLLNQTCYAQCPVGYRSSWTGTYCEPSNDLPVVYFPLQILLGLVLLVSIGGKYSSKNVFGQHRIILSFYAISGLIDVIALWSQFIFTLAQGEAWQVAFPAVALIANYFLNWQYKKLWDNIDPPKPDDDDDLTLEEVKCINRCDMYFDQWSSKYMNVAKQVRRLMMFVSHKFFQLPYTHFYGYLHLTLRIQENFNMWEWDIEDWAKYYNKNKKKALDNNEYFKQKAFENPELPFLYHGKLANKLVDSHGH